MKYYCIRQHDQRDCGAACVASIARTYGIKKTLTYYRNLTKTDINGTNIYGLVEALTNLGFNVAAFSTSINELIELDKSKFPVIARIINDEGEYHFVVLNSIKNNVLYVSDPAKGKYKLNPNEFEQRFTGYIILQNGRAYAKKDKEKSKTILFFLQLLRENRSVIASICITSVIIAFAGVVFSLLIRYEFETLENKEQLEYEGVTFNLDELYEIHEEGDLTENEYINYYYMVENVNWIKDNFFLVFLFLFGSVIVQCIFSYIKQNSYIKIVSKFESSIVSSVTEKILHMPQTHLENWKSGDLIMRYNDAETVANSLINISISLVLETIMAVFGGVLLYNENKVLFAVIAALMSLYVFIVLAYIKPIKTSNIKELESVTRQNSTIKEIVDSVFDIKYCCAEKFNHNRVLNVIDKRIRAYKRARKIDARQQTMIMFSSGISSILLLVASFYMIMNGKMMIATYITFMALADFFIDPIENLVNLQGSIQNGIVALRRLSDVFDDETNQAINCNDNFSLINEIKIDEVTYRYGYRLPVIEKFSATIPAMKHTIVEGNNGCGKSTLVRLLTGMYDIEEGKIYFDSDNIDNISKDVLSKQVIYVSQNSSLLSISIKDNILFGCDYDEQQFNTILDIMEIDDFSESLPKGIDTVVEENGRDLSSGQIQRITIARALLRNPKILILDEATSNIDLKSEARILNKIKIQFPDLTIISVMHKINTEIAIDKIIRMS